MKTHGFSPEKSQQITEGKEIQVPAPAGSLSPDIMKRFQWKVIGREVRDSVES